ncbi:MAG: DapH/DapD/GlmU-related protein [Sulfobacillus sp.]|nr:DapH/DapD/GlmU-related protein [Sulfobacillus sp.]
MAFKQGIGCVIDPDAIIGDEVTLGHYVVVHAGVVIENGVTVGDGTILGKIPQAGRTSTLKTTELGPLVIGQGTVIGAHAILYRGSVIGPECYIADSAQIRERCELGQRVLVGHLATIENDTRVGDFTKLQTGVYLTAKSEVEDHVFLAPMVTTTNDPYIARTEARHQAIRGPRIRRAARVGGGAVLLPGVEIGQEALVAAGAVVTRDVPPYRVVMGVPARVVRHTPAEQWLFAPEKGDDL